MENTENRKTYGKTAKAARRLGNMGWRQGAVLLIAVAGIGGGCAQEETKPELTGIGVDATLTARAAAAGVDIVESESETTHTHTKLSILVDEKIVEVPGDIGIDKAAGVLTILHTHRNDGVIHVESPKAEDTYTLAQFFHLWGIGGGEADLCQHFLAEPYCTVTIYSASTGETSLDKVLVDGDSINVSITALA